MFTFVHHVSASTIDQIEENLDTAPFTPKRAALWCMKQKKKKKKLDIPGIKITGPLIFTPISTGEVPEVTTAIHYVDLSTR